MGKNLLHPCPLLRDRSFVGQLLILLLAWVYLCQLHWDNDGLWFQGDAARHAANGLFWKDYLRSFSLDAKGYALSYYARYPVISLTSYPPAFHLLEAALYGLFSPSPYVAKGLVLCFALMAALYTLAWLRRWIAEEAGWAGALLLLLPGVVIYAHVIMLNMPACALSIGALYHFRRWLEAPDSWHIYPTSVLSVLAVSTYFPSGVIAVIAAAWLLALRRWDVLCRLRTFVMAGVCTLLVLPSLWLAFEWSPRYVSVFVPAQSWQLSKWSFYIEHLDQLFPPYLMAVAGLGVVTGLWSPRWRGETSLLLLWVLITYVFFSLLPARMTRYLLPLSSVLVCFCAMALLTAAQGLVHWARGGPTVLRLVKITALLAVLAVQLWLMPGIRVPAVRGFQEIAAFFAEQAPNEPVLYDGYYNNVFTFYLQAGDPNYHRRVVRGDKLLYVSTIFRHWDVREFAHSPEQVRAILRTRGGCRWLAIERGSLAEEVKPAQVLRETVEGDQFELVASFPVTGWGVHQVDIYRFLEPIQSPDVVDLPFPILGRDAHERAKPIPPRDARVGSEPEVR